MLAIQVSTVLGEVHCVLFYTNAVLIKKNALINLPP